MMTSETRPRCTAVVYERDTYRRTGRTKSGFEMHYTRRTCKRLATSGTLCTQHAKIAPEAGRSA